MNTFELRDETTSRGNQSCSDAPVLDITGRHGRTQLLRNCHEQNSSAVVRVRANDMTRSLLASAPAHAWTDQTRSPRQPWSNAITELRPIAQRLLDRATIALNQESPQGTLPGDSGTDASGTAATPTGIPPLADQPDHTNTAIQDTTTTPESPTIIGTPSPNHDVSDRDLLRAAITTAA